MGCFHQTCAASHMPIVVGDEVACFLLADAREESTDFEGYVSNGAIWQTLTLPFFGVYDDHGSVKDVEPGTGDAINRFVLGKNVTDILKLAHEMRKPPRMNLRGYWGETDLRLMMVHSEVWQLLTSECRTPRGEVIDTHAEEERIPEFLEFARKMSAEYASKMLPAGTPLRPFDQAHEVQHTWGRDPTNSGIQAPYAARFFRAVGESGGIHPILRMQAKEAINRMLMADEPRVSDITDAIELCLYTQVFDTNMANLRRMWAPQPGLGSLDCSYDLHQQLSGWVAGKCAEVKARYEFDEMVEAAP